MPPLGGSLVVEPPSGTALLTEFTLSAVDWLTEDAHLPVSFAFECIGAASSTDPSSAGQPSSDAVPLAEASLATSVSTPLPSGLLPNDQLRVRVVATGALTKRDVIHDEV